MVGLVQLVAFTWTAWQPYKVGPLWSAASLAPLITQADLSAAGIRRELKLTSFERL
jgi:hypothetical protein